MNVKPALLVRDHLVVLLLNVHASEQVVKLVQPPHNQSAFHVRLILDSMLLQEHALLVVLVNFQLEDQQFVKIVHQVVPPVQVQQSVQAVM
jgi:hypothetical protein